MASEVPEYFLPRNWDYPPAGPIRLGNVITSIKDPHRPLATVKPSTDMIITSSKSLAAIETEKVSSGGVAVITTFLNALIGAGVDVGVDVERSSERTFTFDRLDTSYIDMTDEDGENIDQTKYRAYIERCVQSPAVRRYLERKRFRKHVFVITGLKTVTGAKCSTTVSSSTEPLVGAQVDGTILSGGAVPLGGGLELHGRRHKKLNISWEGSNEFVLAFKVSKVIVNRAGAVTKEQDHLKGAFLEDTPEKVEPAKLALEIFERPDVEEICSAFAITEGAEGAIFGVLEDDENEDDN